MFPSGYYRYFSDATITARKIRQNQDEAKKIIRKAMKYCGRAKGSRQITMYLDRSQNFESMR